MAIGIVQEVKFNISKRSKAGKEYTVTQLSFVTENGAKKTESIFTDATFHDVIKTLAPGDKIDAKYSKNGEYFNLTDVKLVEKGNGEAPKFGGGGKQGANSNQKDPEVQKAIIRQNALTNAVNFVTSDTIAKTYVGKPTTDFLSDYVINLAKRFERYTSGKEDEAKLEGAIPEVVVTHDDIPY